MAVLMGGASLFPMNAWSQQVIEVEPLFEYPVAPEELESMADKSNYLVGHFWDSFDFKGKTSVDQNALNHAFRVFTVPMRFADRERSIAATTKILEALSKNPTLLLQFTKAAEENMYGPRADIWVDEVYMQFLNAIVRNKKVPANRKAKYEKQLKCLANSQPAQIAPRFEFENREGNKTAYFPMSTPTLIIFGNPHDADWRMARLKMESNLKLIQAIDKGKINILFIVPGEMDGWKDLVSNYSGKWTVGAADNVREIYDIRTNPAVYVIGADGKIVGKNLTLNSAVAQILQQISD